MYTLSQVCLLKRQQGKCTPLKINIINMMEPKHHPVEKEHHLNQTSMFVVHVNFPGCGWNDDVLSPPMNHYLPVQFAVFQTNIPKLK